MDAIGATSLLSIFFSFELKRGRTFCFSFYFCFLITFAWSPRPSAEFLPASWTAFLAEIRTANKWPVHWHFQCPWASRYENPNIQFIWSVLDCFMLFQCTIWVCGKRKTVWSQRVEMQLRTWNYSHTTLYISELIFTFDFNFLNIFKRLGATGRLLSLMSGCVSSSFWEGLLVRPCLAHPRLQGRPCIESVHVQTANSACRMLALLLYLPPMQGLGKRAHETGDIPSDFTCQMPIRVPIGNHAGFLRLSYSALPEFLLATTNRNIWSYPMWITVLFIKRCVNKVSNVRLIELRLSDKQAH